MFGWRKFLRDKTRHEEVTKTDARGIGNFHETRKTDADGGRRVEIWEWKRVAQTQEHEILIKEHIYQMNSSF